MKEKTASQFVERVNPASSEITLSIVIVSWNSSECLYGCIKAILESGFEESWEIIVIDNGSSDGSASIVKRDFPFVTVLQNKENVGFVRGNNQGLKISRGTFILFLNPDTKVTSGAISGLLNYLRGKTNIGAIGPLLLNADGSYQNSFFQFPNFLSILLEFALSSRMAAWKERNPVGISGPQNVHVIRGACFLTRRDLLRSIDGMNEHLFMYAEETDLCYKFFKLGFDRVFFPAAQVYHFERRSVDQQPHIFTAFHYFRSNIIFLKDNYPKFKSYILIAIIYSSLYFKRCLYTFFNREKKVFFSNLIHLLESQELT